MIWLRRVGFALFLAGSLLLSLVPMLGPTVLLESVAIGPHLSSPRVYAFAGRSLDPLGRSGLKGAAAEVEQSVSGEGAGEVGARQSTWAGYEQKHRL